MSRETRSTDAYPLTEQQIELERQRLQSILENWPTDQILDLDETGKLKILWWQKF